MTESAKIDYEKIAAAALSQPGIAAAALSQERLTPVTQASTGTA